MEQYLDTHIVSQTYIGIIKYSRGVIREKKSDYYLWKYFTARLNVESFFVT